MTRTLAAALCVLALAACSKPEPPDKDRPPEPTADATAATAAQDATWDASKREKPATELRDAIQAPINKAKAVEGTVLEQGEQQRADIEAQTSGNTSTPPAQ
jgi:hypothetical protein